MRARSEHALVAGASVAVATAGVALDPSASAPWDLLFGACLFFGLLTLLRLALRAGRRARHERHRARRLAQVSPAENARRAVAQEERRLAADVEAVVRSAVLRMASSADRALQEWERDPHPALRDVQEEGQRATVELRRLLGLLREPGDPVPAAARPAAAGAMPSRGDVLVAAAAVLLALAESAAYGEEATGGPQPAASVGFTALAASTVVVRRTRPWLGTAACGAVFLLAHAVGFPVSSGLWTLVTPGGLAWASTARQRRLPVGLTAVAVLLTGVVVSLAAHDPANVRIVVVIIVGSAVGGLAVRGMDRSERSARHRAAERAQHLERAAEEAVRARRLGVARDLHDLVSSAVGVMVVHSGAAEALRATDPAAARAALDVVRRTAAETVGELAALAAVTGGGRSGVPPPAGGVVEHGMADVEEVVERMRGAGLTISFTANSVPPRPGGPSLPPAVAGAVYRTVQESLTNAARHAPGAAVTVVVGVGPDAVCVDVVDDGPGRSPVPRRGYGLVGISERVEHLGGSLHAGPGDDGRGFRVRVRVPLGAAHGVGA
ncbi:sensor histidine kinase [Kineococcus glutinatus]|uniref:histidine kinase n=1 Tax=Kineococcus glutinatus TaxID=1070872 RepID=A0ABP9HY13_9ACTN